MQIYMQHNVKNTYNALMPARLHFHIFCKNYVLRRNWQLLAF